MGIKSNLKEFISIENKLAEIRKQASEQRKKQKQLKDKYKTLLIEYTSTRKNKNSLISQGASL